MRQWIVSKSSKFWRKRKLTFDNTTWLHALSCLRCQSLPLTHHSRSGDAVMSKTNYHKKSTGKEVDVDSINNPAHFSCLVSVWEFWPCRIIPRTAKTWMWAKQYIYIYIYALAMQIHISLFKTFPPSPAPSITTITDGNDNVQSATQDQGGLWGETDRWENTVFSLLVNHA